MLTTLRREYAQLTTSGGQLLLLLVGFHLRSHTAWLWCLGSMAFISLFAWYSTLYRLRAIYGTPTSRIGSAAQGYVELIGHGEVYGTPVLSRYSYLPCLWCRYKLERRRSDHKGWNTEEHGEDGAPFIIDDGSGKCVVDPQGAEVLTKHKDCWTKDDYRYTEWKLLDIDFIYTLGEFKTVGGSNTTLTQDELVKQVLSEWKMDNDDSAQALRPEQQRRTRHAGMDAGTFGRQARSGETHERGARRAGYQLHVATSRWTSLSHQQLGSR